MKTYRYIVKIPIKEIIEQVTTYKYDDPYFSSFKYTEETESKPLEIDSDIELEFDSNYSMSCFELSNAISEKLNMLNKIKIY